MIGRDELVADLLTALRPEVRTGPQVVVGDSGSGKTSVLLRLAAKLAQDNDVLPIVLPLEGKEGIDFYALARERFEEYIDPHVRATSDVDRLWRWMSKRGKIVILADDLDRAVLPSADKDPNRRFVRAALEASTRRGLPLVVTSRPYGVPRELTEPPITLGPLEVEASAVANHIVPTGSAGGGASETSLRQVVEATVECGKLLDNVFYLDLVRDLVHSRRRLTDPSDRNKHAVRISLLNLWYQNLLGENVGKEEEDRRRRMLADVCEFAKAILTPLADSKASAKVNRKTARSLQSIERAGGVVFLDDDAQYRFVHEVLHAYLASRSMVRHPAAALDALEKEPDFPRLQLAVILAAAETHDPRFCRDVCERLLRSGGSEDPEARLLRAAAAAEVVLAGEYVGLDSRIAKECAAGRTGASPIARRTAVDQLAELSGEAAIETLWEYLGDADYGVRWAALEKLVTRCAASERSPREGHLAGGAAYRVLAGKIQSDLVRAQVSLAGGRQPDDWEPEILPLKLAGWILPALRTALTHSDDSSAASMATTQLNELLRLEAADVTVQKGLEASIAQGFKIDARLFRASPVDEEVISRLNRKKAFWYSRLNLLHALTLRSDRRTADERMSILRRFVDDNKQHPFVRAASQMCLKALKEAVNLAPIEANLHIDRYVWDDESVVVSRAPRKLVDEAIQLVGEIMVLLNLNEGGTAEQRLTFGEANGLPYCFQGSRERKEFFDKCVDGATCGFQLCPIGPPLDRLSARRDISRAFCRHQRFHASARTARLWGSSVQKRALREFWLRIESAARF